MSTGVDLSAVLRPVREGNAFEETVERLLTVIKLGVVGPGERFPAERELAAQLGISRLTLREAIRELQQGRVRRVQARQARRNLHHLHQAGAERRRPAQAGAGERARS